MAEASPFSRKSLGWLVGIACGSFLIALVLLVVTSDQMDTRSAAAAAFSRSAIGHAGLVEMLRKLKVPVVVSQHDSARKASGAALMVAEPRLGEGPTVEDTQLRALEEMLQAAGASLLVLPKWRGVPQVMVPGWIASADVLPESAVLAVLGAAKGKAGTDKLVRLAPDKPLRWQASPDDTLLGWPAPKLIAPQLVVSDRLSPLLASDQGVLFGKLEGGPDGRRLYVLSDPDLLSNHGIGRGDNALVTLRILDLVREGEGAVVIDETMHGHKRLPTLWQELFRFPLVLAMLQAIAALGVLLWAGMGRFGAPGLASPAIAPGKRYLIDNTAALLRHGGHFRQALTGYLRMMLQETARALHAPAHHGTREQRDWLERAAAARRLPRRLAELEREVTEVVADPRNTGPAGARRALAVARRIHAFHQEIVHGPRNHRSGL
jgi:hypothetical protein